MDNAPHVIETALLLLVAFLFGCIIGWFFRTKIFASAQKDTNSDAAPTASPAEATNMATVATPVAKPTPAKSRPAPKPVSKSTTSKTSSPKSEAESAAEIDADRPEVLSAPRGGAKDDLKKINGVGPKLEGKLNELGIFHFDQIAAWDRKAIEWVDNSLSFKGRIDRDDWVAQAKKFTQE